MLQDYSVGRSVRHVTQSSPGLRRHGLLPEIPSQANTGLSPAVNAGGPIE